jgi:competence protein ComFC
MMKILNLLFPPKCIFCGGILRFDCNIDICEACYKKLPFFKDNTDDFYTKVADSIDFDEIICLFEYSGIIKESIIRYKFFNKVYYYRTFAKFLSDKVKRVTTLSDFDMCISVPLFRKKEFERGYNQAYLISKVLSKELHIPEGSSSLERIKNTDAQSLLAKNQRVQNIKNAFQVKNPDRIKNKNILLVDDIFTTGSTIDECSRVLKAAGAKSVVAAVIASGRKY